MHARQARVLALAVSSAVAAVIFWFGWQWLQARPKETVKMTTGERPVPLDSDPTGRNGSTKTSDPIRPEDWRFYLSREQANGFFSLKQNPRVVYDPWMGMHEIPNENSEMVWQEHPERMFVFHTNSLGCREDHELDDPLRDLRILVAGDSHTCGICNNSESFANRLEAAIATRRQGKSVEALNTGLGGYHFWNYLGALFRFRAFKPQVFVCAIFGGNDFADTFWLYLHFSKRPWPSSTEAEDRRRKDALKISADAMGQGLAELDTMRSFPAERPTMTEAAVQMCLEMQRVAEKQKCVPIFVYIPCPFEFPWPKQEAKYVKTRDALEFTDADFAMLSEVATKTLDELRAKGARVIDMRPIFAQEPTPPYWRADFHLNLRGHELIARELEPLVDELLPRE